MKKINGIGIRTLAIKERAERRKSGGWLHKATSFNSSLFLDKGNKAIADKLYSSFGLAHGYKQEQKQKDFEILIANLLTQTRKPISISLNRNNWVKTKYNPVSYFITDLIDALRAEKLIEMKIGFDVPNKPSHMTRIWATDKLLQIFPEYHSGVLYSPVQLVEVKNEKKKLIDYKDTDEVRRIRRILEKINKINNEAEIMHISDHKCLRLNTSLVAIFYKKLTLGGRLYARGISRFQALSSTERQDITINGNHTVERDFKALHPFLLYAAEGIQLETDPYTLVDSRPILRPLLKKIFLSMVNGAAKGRKSALNGARFALYKQQKEIWRLQAIDPDVPDFPIISVKPIMEMFKEKHQKIAHNFCQGKEIGQRLTNKESKIALDVIDHFAKQNIPILCIHDSFIVEVQHEDELIHVMESTYTKHTHFRCIVK